MGVSVQEPANIRKSEAEIVFGFDDRPPLAVRIPLGLQHLVAMLLGNITPPLLIAGGLGLATGETAFLLQMALILAGLATLVQAYPIGVVGARLPIVMGTTIAFVGASVVTGREYGLGAVFGACLVASIVEIALGLSISRLKRFFPPLVNAVVVILIGLTLIPVGMDYAAGGPGSTDYGSLVNLSVAAVVFLLTLFLNQFARGFWSYGSLLFGVLVGYGVAFWLGLVDYSVVSQSGWVEIPRLFPYKLEFHVVPIVLMGFVYVVTTMETVGDISGTVAVAHRNPTDDELRGGLVADGVMSGVASLFGAFPNTSYSQNVGLVNFSGVASRHVTAVSGIALVLLGLIPKVGALFATIPPAVIGGGGLIMFAMIFASGLAIIHREVDLDRRNMIILAVSVGLGLGCELRSEVLQNLPELLGTLLGSGLVTGGLVALALNLVLPAGTKNG